MSANDVAPRVRASRGSARRSAPNGRRRDHVRRRLRAGPGRVPGGAETGLERATVAVRLGQRRGGRAERVKERLVARRSMTQGGHRRLGRRRAARHEPQPAAGSSAEPRPPAPSTGGLGGRQLGGHGEQAAPVDRADRPAGAGHAHRRGPNERRRIVGLDCVERRRTPRAPIVIVTP